MDTQRHEIEAYLGDFVDQVTGDQIDDLTRISNEINTRYMTDEPERAAAFVAAVQYVLGNTNADRAARDYQDAKQRCDETLAAAVQVASMTGLSEVAAAKTIGIARNTYRKHLNRERPRR